MVEEQKSPYQEGGFQLNRLNLLQEKINMLNLNLMAFDDDIGQYNYQIKFDCLNTLFSEVASLATGKNEKEKADRYKKVIDNLLLANSPHQEKKVIGGWGVIKKEMQFSLKDFEPLKNILYDYEMFIRKLIDKYFRSKTKENKSGKPLY